MSNWMVETLFASTLLMALVMLLRRPAARWFGTRAAYMLWALPLLRMLLPPLPTQAPAAAVLPVTPEPVARFVTAHLVAAPADTAVAFPWIELALAVWFVGAVLFFIVQIAGYARFRALLLSDAEDIGREGRVRIIESAHATGPLAFGIFHPFVALPVDFADRYEGEERSMAITHELTHHRRGDLLANLFALGLLGLHWCNPLAWIAYRAFRADQELACDAQVLASETASAQAYGRAILKAASGRHFAAACHLNTVRNLKGRLVMLSSHSQSLNRITTGMIIVALLTAFGLAFTASGSRAAQEMASVSEKVADAKLSHLTRIASFIPQAVQPPVAPAAPEVVEAPEAPLAPEAPVQAHDPAWADIPADVSAPPAPVTSAIPPVPPTPPAPRWNGRTTYRTADGSVRTIAVPNEADIRAMVPDVTVNHDCDAKSVGKTIESVGADGRHKLHVFACDRAIARDAQIQAMQARRVAIDARREDARARVEAIRGLQQARAEIARDRDMGDKIRADILADMDREIARMRSSQD